MMMASMSASWLLLYVVSALGRIAKSSLRPSLLGSGSVMIVWGLSFEALMMRVIFLLEVVASFFVIISVFVLFVIFAIVVIVVKFSMLLNCYITVLAACHQLHSYLTLPYFHYLSPYCPSTPSFLLLYHTALLWSLPPHPFLRVLTWSGSSTW